MSSSYFAPDEIQKVNTLIIYSANEILACTHCANKIFRNELFSRSADKTGLVEGIRYTWCQTCKPINNPDNHLPLNTPTITEADVFVLQKQLDFLSEHNIDFYAKDFYANYYNPFLKSSEVIEYIRNTELFAAKKLHVELNDLRQWHEHIVNPCCHSLTKKGKNCGGYVHQLPLKEFIKQNCVIYCNVHQ